MEKIFNIKTLVLASTVMLSGLALSGCGSSSSGVTTSSVSANGIYSGNITGGLTNFSGIEEKGIIFNGRLLAFSNKADGVTQIFEANLSEPGISLAASGTRYDSFGPTFNSVIYSGAFVTDVSATVAFEESTTGAVTLPPGTINLVENVSLYTKGSILSRLAGTWTGAFIAGAGMSLNIDANGTIGANSGDDGGTGTDCGFTGNFRIVEAAINVYAVNLISDGGVSGCGVDAGAYSGLAWTEGDTNGTLVVIAADGNNARAAVLTKN